MSVEKLVKELGEKEVVLVHNVSGVEFGQSEYMLLLYSGKSEKDDETGLIQLGYLWMGELVLSQPDVRPGGFTSPEIDEEVRKVREVAQPKIVYSTGDYLPIDPKKDRIYRLQEIRDMLNITDYHNHLSLIDAIAAKYSPVEIQGQEKGKEKKGKKKREKQEKSEGAEKKEEKKPTIEDWIRHRSMKE